MDFKDWCERYMKSWNSNPNEKPITLEECLNSPLLKETFEKGKEVGLGSPEQSARVTGLFFRVMDIAYENLQQLKKK